MRFVTDSPSQNLSGWTLFPELDRIRDDFNTIRSNKDYLVSSLAIGATNQSFLQIGDGANEDVDTFVMHLDAGDIYQVVFSTSETDQFLNNRGMTVFGVNGDFVDGILNDYGDTFSPSGTLTTRKFIAEQSGDYLLFTKFRNWDGPVTASYGLTLEKVEDVTPWDISLTRNGMGAKAILASGDETIAAGTRITISLTFAKSNVTFDDIRMLVSGSISTSASSIGNSTTVSIVMAASEALNMRDLIEVSFSGGGDAGSLEVSRIFVWIDGSSPIVDIGDAVFTPGDMVLVGTARDDVLSGDIGDDRISGRAGDDTLSGGAGDDRLNGGTGSDSMSGGAGDDIYRVDSWGDAVREYARRGADTVQSAIGHTLADNLEKLTLLGTDAINGAGNGAANAISGNVGANTLRGMAGEDTLTGGAGDDRLDGGAGKDQLAGGAGTDRFVLVALSDSTVRAAGRDTIADFSLAEHDLIHLGAIDANARRGGNQSFSYLGDAAFTGQAGELSARIVTGGTMISGDVDGDRIADFALRLDDRIALGADSFIL